MRMRTHIEADLATLVRLLVAPHTARELAVKLSCSRQTVYKRLAVLCARGQVVACDGKRQGSTGPAAQAYCVI